MCIGLYLCMYRARAETKPSRFDALASTWNERPFIRRTMQLYLHWIEQHATLNSDTTTVLDFACGTGLSTERTWGLHMPEGAIEAAFSIIAAKQRRMRGTRALDGSVADGPCRPHRWKRGWVHTGGAMLTVEVAGHECDGAVCVDGACTGIRTACFCCRHHSDAHPPNLVRPQFLRVLTVSSTFSPQA